jgi:hypothetical protein
MTTKARHKTRKTPTKLRVKGPVAARKPIDPAAPTRPVARSGKQGQLIALLEREQGATIAEAADALHWQTHSIRGAMSGVLKKKLKLKIQKLTGDAADIRYRLVS